MARAYDDATGSTTSGLRYMNVYGARQDYRGAYIAVIMKMLDAIDRGEPVTLSATARRHTTSSTSTDCAAANVCAMKADATDALLQRRHRRAHSLRELAELRARDHRQRRRDPVRAAGPDLRQEPHRRPDGGRARPRLPRRRRPRGACAKWSTGGAVHPGRGRAAARARSRPARRSRLTGPAGVDSAGPPVRRLVDAAPRRRRRRTTTRRAAPALPGGVGAGRRATSRRGCRRPTPSVRSMR